MTAYWVQVVLFVIAVGAIAVAWWGIAVRVTKVQTRKGLARIDAQPSDQQLLGLVLHNAEDARVKQATGEISAQELQSVVADIRADDTTDDTTVDDDDAADEASA